MFHNLYEDLPAPKSSSSSRNTAPTNEQFAVKVSQNQTESDVPPIEEQIVKPKKETTPSSRWSTAAVRMLQPPPSVLVKRQNVKVSKPVVKETKIVVSEEENEKDSEHSIGDNKPPKEEEGEEDFKAQQLEAVVATGRSAYIVDEYDPHRPNDFETCLQEREWRKAQQVVKSSLG